MNAKEKAKELIKKMLEEQVGESMFKYTNAKQCASLAVDEIIRVCKDIYFEHLDKEADKQCNF